MSSDSSPDSTGATSSSRRAQRQMKKKILQKRNSNDKEQVRGLLDEGSATGPQMPPSPQSAAARMSSSSVSRLRSPSDGADDDEEAAGGIERHVPLSSPPSTAPFAALSGGDDHGGEDDGSKRKKSSSSSSSTSSSEKERKKAAKDLSALTGKKQSPVSHRRHEYVETHHPLPASSPPAFIRMPSPDDSPTPSPPPHAASLPLTSSTRLVSRDGDEGSGGGGGGNGDGDDDTSSDQGLSAHTSRSIWRLRCRELFSYTVWLYYFSHSWRELKKRKCNYALGLFSVFLVVCVAAVCYTLIARAPVVFLQQAESSAGQIDLEITPSLALGSIFMNYTQLGENVDLSSDYSYHSSRSLFYVKVLPEKSCSLPMIPGGGGGGAAAFDFFVKDWPYVGFFNESSPASCLNSTLNCLLDDTAGSGGPLCVFPPQIRTENVPLWVIDTEREERMGLGRLWPRGKLEKGEVVVTSDLASQWGVNVGDTLMLRLSPSSSMLLSLFRSSFIRAMEWDSDPSFSPASTHRRMDQNASFILDQFVRHFLSEIFVPVRTVQVIEKTYGKFLTDTDPLLVMESERFLEHVREYLHPAIRGVNSLADMVQLLSVASDASSSSSASSSLSPQTIEKLNQALRNTTTPVLPYSSLLSYPFLLPSAPFGGLSALSSYSTHILANMPPNRVSVYLNTNFDRIQDALIEWSSHVIYFAGFTQVDTRLPVLDEMGKVKLFSLYLGLILSIILTILFLLSMLLIYSLLMISIETRTFELGVHRMTGMNRFNLMKLLIVQSLSFSIPAWILGLVCSQIMVAIIVGNLEASVEVPLDKLLTRQSVGVASCMGLLLPLLASILPIRAALGHNLQDALDTRHSKTMGVAFQIERSVDAGVDSAWMAIGVGLAVLGGSIYYLVPLALLSFNLALFFNIFFALLLGMLLGLILLSLNFQPILERSLVFLLLSWWEKRAIAFLVVKNLIAHRDRNRKTSVMFALSLGFILFITMAFQLELWTAKARMYKNYGSEMIVYPHYNGEVLYPADVAALEQLLLQHSDVVKEWSWVSGRLNWNGEWDDTYLSNLGHAFSSEVEIWGVSSNFYETTFNDYLVVDSATPAPSSTLFSEQLYTVGGSQAAIMGTSAKQQFGLQDLDGSSTNFLFELQKRAGGTDARGNPIDASLQFHRFRPLIFLDNSPRFNLGRFPSRRPQPTIVSLPTFLRLSNNAYKSIQDIPMSSCILKFHRGGVSTAMKDSLATALQQFAARRDFLLWDIRKTSSQLDRSNAVMSLIFSIATYIAMFLCLFSLVASMLTNIYEQSKEISVLRALGLTKRQITRLYTYEAFTLVMSSSLLGISIGFVMSATLIAQRILFTQLPVPFLFPWTILFYTFSGALICAVVSSMMPARKLMEKSIASIMKSVL